MNEIHVAEAVAACAGSIVGALLTLAALHLRAWIQHRREARLQRSIAHLLIRP